MLLYDEFPEHEKVMRLKGVGAKWLHIVALCQSSRNLTDGFIDAQRLKVICAIADVPRPAFCVKQLVDVGLWIELEAGCYEIKDYLKYNRSASTVKGEREAKRAAGRIGGLRSGEARRQARAEAAASPSASGSGSTPDPGPYPDPSTPYRPVAAIESVGAALALLETIPDAYKDPGTRKIILAYAQEGLPPDAFRDVQAELASRDDIRNPAKYANGALKKLAHRRHLERTAA